MKSLIINFTWKYVLVAVLVLVLCPLPLVPAEHMFAFLLLQGLELLPESLLAQRSNIVLPRIQTSCL
jgi:hypothetical protein